MNRRVCIVIPVYNEAPIIAKTVQEAQQLSPFVVCVNDGSRDDSSAQILKTSAYLVEHPVNMGQGAALQTGIEFALQFPEVEQIITFDADGQHDIADARRMLKILKQEQLDVVLGSRFSGRAENIPRTKKLMLRLAVWFTNVFSGVQLTDTHNGLRVFNRRFAQALNIAMPGMAHASEIVDKIGRGEWRYREVPVTIRYTDYSQAKGQSMLNSINIFVDLVFSRSRK